VPRGYDARARWRQKEMKVPEEGFPRPLRVMLVEDHASFRQALAFMLAQDQDFEVVAQAGTLAEARRGLDGRDGTDRIEAAVIDLALPDGNGAELVGDLSGHNPDMTVLVLSATLSRENLTKAVQAGADGVLDKLAGVGEIVGELRRLSAGAALPSQQQVVEALLSIDQHHDPDSYERTALGSITPREREMLRALAEGLNSEEIAERLSMTAEEEHARVANVIIKLGARSRLQALAVAARLGIVEVE
jgi:two-component system, NarL family, nitrate/nitrite response regulator NarL